MATLRTSDTIITAIELGTSAIHLCHIWTFMYMYTYKLIVTEKNICDKEHRLVLMDRGQDPGLECGSIGTARICVSAPGAVQQTNSWITVNIRCAMFVLIVFLEHN